MFALLGAAIEESVDLAYEIYNRVFRKCLNDWHRNSAGTESALGGSWKPYELTDRFAQET